MKNLKFVFISVIIAAGIGAFFFSHFLSSSEDKYVDSIWEYEWKEGGVDFGYCGIKEGISDEWDAEKPDGIEKMEMSTKLMRNFQYNDDSFFLAYKFELKLQPQERKKFKISSKHIYGIVSYYETDFIFFLLDKDDYHLMTIYSDGGNKELTPGDCSLIFSENNFKEKGQAVLTFAPIPKNVAERVQKIVFYPRFRVGSWDPVETQ